MKAFKYIRYFIHIALNWNVRLAMSTIYHEIRGERKYKLNTTGINDLAKLQLKGRYKNEAEVYQGASYLVTEKLFQYVQSHSVAGSIIDYGCGKGRVLVIAAYFGFRKITGVEFAKELWLETVNNIDLIRGEFPDTVFTVLHENAVSHTIQKDDQVFFFFNPFQNLVMKKVLANILDSLRKDPRRIYIVYVNPQLKKLFLDEGFEEVYYFRKMQYVEGVVLMI
ncbi:MAG: class I SAM-dependent methyltransferase [Chitinophagaceae bacterium]